MNHSRLLHIYDFAATPYDGDARQAHQLIPFILAKLGTAKLSYILNIKDFPDPKPDSLLVLLEAEHSKAMWYTYIYVFVHAYMYTDKKCGPCTLLLL